MASSGITQAANAHLEMLISESGMSHKRLAHRLNEICAANNVAVAYTHTSVANWCRRGMCPRWPVPQMLCVVLMERLGRPVVLADIGMTDEGHEDQDVGLAFPRNQQAALAAMASYWSVLNRRTFLSSAPFTATAFTEPFTRWLVSPTEGITQGSGAQRVGRAEIEELREMAESARRWDSRFGGTTWKSQSITAYLDKRVAPLLTARYTDTIGRELFSVTAEMARLAGWTAFDAGQHQAAQRHYVQALRLAKASSDVNLGAYVLTTMAMQAMMRGFTSQAIDMAQGAYTRVPSSDPRIRGFAKLIEARAHAREGDGPSASRCLALAEQLQEQGAAEQGNADLAWIEFFSRQRIVTDATEIFRDLGNPQATFAWHAMGAMPGDAYARSRGIRLSVLASAHAQRGELDESLRLGRESLRLFTQLQTVRGIDYLQIYARSLSRWRHDPAVQAYTKDIHRLKSDLTKAA